MCEYIDMLEARGEARGITIGETKGETRLTDLIQVLLREKKFSEIVAVSRSREKRHELYRQYGIGTDIGMIQVVWYPEHAMECDRNFMYLGKMLEIIFRWSKIDNSHWYRLINMENNNKGKKAKPTAGNCR